MRVYIIRHGKAADQGLDNRPGATAQERDFSRELVERGREQARYLAQALAGEGRRFRAVIASRYPRAMQTAHALWESLKCDLHTDERLEVDHPVSEAIQVIEEWSRAHDRDRDIILVAHNPQLGELIGVLCSGLPAHEIMLRTGECVVIEVRPGQIIGSGRLINRLRLAEQPAHE